MRQNEFKIKVSIVEDNEDFRDALTLLLNGSTEFSCLQVYASAEAAINCPPDKDTDVILMDIQLPDKSGIECMMNLKQKLPSAQFMMCTVFNDDVNIFDALAAGANGYILKTTPPGQVLEALRQLHDGGSPMSAEIARKVIGHFRRDIVSKEADALTSRELEIITLLSQGFLYKEIAQQLNVADNTIKKHIHNVYGKLQVQNRTEAINKVFKK